jgi:hypothetical protein
MSTEAAAVVLALVGVAAVVAVSWVFYRIGKAEDREREAARRPPPAPSPEPEPEPDPPADEHRVARERRRPLPPRRPQR